MSLSTLNIDNMKALLINRQDSMVVNRVFSDMLVDWVMVELKGSRRKGLVFPSALLKHDGLCIFDGDKPYNADNTEYYRRMIAEENKNPNHILELKSRLMLLSDIIVLPSDDDVECYWFTSDSVFEPATIQDIADELKSIHMLCGDILIARYKTPDESECGVYWHFEPHETLDHWTPVTYDGGGFCQPVYRIK